MSSAAACGSPSLSKSERAAQLAAWSEELIALEAIYTDSLTHDDGATDAAGLAEAAAAAEEAVAADAEAARRVRVCFTVLLDGGGLLDEAAASDASRMPPGELRLQITFRSGYPSHRVLPSIALVHGMLSDVLPAAGADAVELYDQTGGST